MNIQPARGVFVAAALLLVASGARAIPPRPVSDAERAAVQIAADYLSRGPAAVAERLASASPLRSLQGQQLADEIEARLGPWSGARWELQSVVPALADKAAAFSISFPSGVDDTAILELTLEGGAFRVVDIKTLAMPSAQTPIFAVAAEVSKPAETPAETPKNSLPLGGGIVASALGITAALTRRRNATVARLMMGGAAAIIVGFGTMTVLQQRKGQAPKDSAAKSDAADASHLGALVQMRRDMTTGSGEAGVVPAGCRSSVCRDAAELWKAQAELQQLRLVEADAILKKYPSPSRIPLAEILRGRVALVKSNEADSAAGYEHAINLGPGRDGLWYEAAQSLMSLGYDDRARRCFARLEKVGSREPDAYYSLSILSAQKKRDDEAVAYLKRAWSMKPARREQVVGAAALWSVIRHESIVPLVTLSAPKEATFASAAASSRPIAIPQGAVARMSGDFLHVQIGEAELFVPGGAALAPQGAAIVDAGAWARDEDERGLREFPQLASVARTAGAMAQPALRRRVQRAAHALANHNRWNDLVSLTDGLSPKSELVPAEMFFLRSQALNRMQRGGEGRALLNELATSTVLQRRRDASALEELGEMLASHELYDTAITVFDRAQAIRTNPFTDDRVRQLQMNKRLATKYGTHRSEHFQIQYPEDLSAMAAKQIADIAEAEFKRMQKWIPLPNPAPIVINVIWWDEFRATYTGNDFVVGFYNGKVTVPLAGVRMFIPEVVTVLTHEVAHAMIAQASNDQAPRWFQEGLAQRVEMRDFHANAFNMYEDDRLIAASLLDAVLSGSPDPEMIGEAYIESQTVIRYIEAAKGEKSIPKMIESFRAGATTEEAIQQVMAMPPDEFDVKLREWGRSGARVFDNPPPVRYDTPEDDGVRWSKRRSR